MVWAAISALRKNEIVFLEGRQRSENYVRTLGGRASPFAQYHYGADCHFQQDIAGIHTSRERRAFFAEKGARVLDWPARSADLNPIV